MGLLIIHLCPLDSLNYLHIFFSFFLKKYEYSILTLYSESLLFLALAIGCSSQSSKTNCEYDSCRNPARSTVVILRTNLKPINRLAQLHHCGGKTDTTKKSEGGNPPAESRNI